jgi:hypothetical protein
MTYFASVRVRLTVDVAKPPLAELVVRAGETHAMGTLLDVEAIDAADMRAT